MSKTPQKYKISGKKAAAVAFGVLAALLLVIEAMGLTHVITGLFSTEMSIIQIGAITYEAGSSPQLHGTADGFFLITRNSVRFIYADGVEGFRDSHPLTNPVLFGRGEFAAIVEQGGSVVQVYNTSGLMHRIAVGGPVISLALGTTGYFSVITHIADTGIYNISAYDNLGRLLVGGPHPYPSIVPMLMDFSRDGNTLAISYLDINDAQINSTINFVFTRQADYLAHSYTHGIFASSLSNPGQIIGAMRFMQNGNLVAISDTRIFAVEPSSGLTIWENPVSNRITWFYIGRDLIVVTYGEALLNRHGSRPPGTVSVYNQNGENLFTHTMAAGRIDIAASCGNSVVVGVDGHFTAFSRSGAVLWEYALPNNVSDIVLIGGYNRFVAANPTEAVIHQRVRR